MEKIQVPTKSEPNVVEIKKEDITPESSDDELNYYSDFVSKRSNSNNDLPVKTEPETTVYSEKNRIKTEDDSSDDSSDYFDEPCYSIKTEKEVESDSKSNNNEIDSAFYDRDYEEAYIKEDIEFEEHDIKLEAIKCKEENTNNQKKQDDFKKANAAFRCNLCSYKTSFQSSFKKHSSLHEDPSKVLLYFCTKCNYRTRQKCHLKRHDLVHQSGSELTMFECAICDFKTKQKCTLKRHLDFVHLNRHRKNVQRNDTDKNEEFFCNECSYKTYKRGLLLSHLDKHKDTRDATNLYICDICSFSTKYRRNLRVHFETHKESQELQIYECKLCSFKTRMGYCLKRHFLSRKHLLAAGKIEEYCPRTLKL